MGYEVYGSGRICFEANKLPKIIDAINGGLTFTNASEKTETLLNYVGMKEVSDDLIYEFFERLSFSIAEESTNFEIDGYYNSNYHSDDVMAVAALVDYMDLPAQMEFNDGLGSFWRWIFDKEAKNHCIYEDGYVTYESNAASPKTLSCVENNYMFGEAIGDPVMEEEGDIWGGITIDGWFGDVDQGAVIATVIMSKHGDLLVVYHDNSLRMDNMVKNAIQDAKNRLQDMWDEQQKAVQETKEQLQKEWEDKA